MSNESPKKSPKMDEETFDFLKDKVDPIFVPLMKNLMTEMPEDVLPYCLKYFNGLNSSAASPMSGTSTMHPSLIQSPVTAPRPSGAIGSWLRILTMNNNENLDNFARFSTAVSAAKASSTENGCEVSTHLNGDFVGHGTLTALDHGRGQVKVMNSAQIDFTCLGGFEVAMGVDMLSNRLMEVDANVINSNMRHDALTENLAPNFGVLHVGDRWGVFGGFLGKNLSTSTESNPFTHQPQIDDNKDSAMLVWRDAVEQLRHYGMITKKDSPSFFIPLTYEDNETDVKFIQDLMTSSEKNDEKASLKMMNQNSLSLKHKIPLLFGSYDGDVSSVKEISNESKDDGCKMIKLGRNENSFGVVDLWWDIEGNMQTNVEFVSADLFDQAEQTQDIISDVQGFAKNRLCLPLHRFNYEFARSDLEGVGGSMKEAENEVFMEDKVDCDRAFMISYLLKLLKLGSKKQAVDIAMIHSSALKGGDKVRPFEGIGLLNVEHLFTEMLADQNQAVVRLPGWMISASIANSRKKNLQGELPAHYLHCDCDCVIESIDGGDSITFINEKPFISQQLYTVIMSRDLLEQTNLILPLNAYVKRNIELPPLEQCRPIKHIIIKGCFHDMLRKQQEINKSLIEDNAGNGNSVGSVLLPFEFNNLNANYTISDAIQSELNEMMVLLESNNSDHEFYLALEAFLAGDSSGHEHYHDDFLLEEFTQNLSQALGISRSDQDSPTSSISRHVKDSHQHHEAKQLLQHVVGDGKEEWVRRTQRTDEYEDAQLKSKHQRFHRTSLSTMVDSTDPSNKTSVATILEEGVEFWELNADFDI